MLGTLTLAVSRCGVWLILPRYSVARTPGFVQDEVTHASRRMKWVCERGGNQLYPSIRGDRLLATNCRAC